MLRAEWKNESAQHRAELLTCLEISLSVADEDFLEEVRGGDRSSTVRDEALRLLRMIPESRILRLFAETLKKHLHYRRLFGWAVDSIAYSEEFKKLGINEVSSNKGESDSDYILRQMAQFMPLSFWCEFFDCDSETAAQRMRKSPPFSKHIYLTALIECLEREVFDERYAVYLYIIDLCTELDGLGFLASDDGTYIMTDVLDSLTPAQQVIKIVNDELTALMGGTNAKLTMASRSPTVVMMVGLQGAGKTTNCAKLAGLMRKNYSKRPLLAACDVYRPAAIEQLKVVGAQLDLPVFEMGQGDPVKIAEAAVRHAQDHGNDMVFLDTAGRLHIDEALMDELKNIKASVHPNEILLVVDAMTGQDAVNAATAFDEALGIDGVLLTKLDGDARGGAALSIKATTGKPIKFAGTGEKLDMIEPFHPDRMASRILGMGDVLSLIEKAEQTFDQKKAAELDRKLKKSRLSLADFLDEMREMKKMGDISQIASMLPGGMGRQLEGAELDPKVLNRSEAIILSMTPYERENPNVLDASRKRRIAAGCGLEVSDVNRLLKQYDMMNQIAKQMYKGRGKLGALAGLGGSSSMGGNFGGGLRGFGRKKRLR